MRILLASSSSGSRGGGEIYLLYLGRALARRGHQVQLWASAHPRMDELAQSFPGSGEVVRMNYTNTYDRRLRSLAAHLDGSTAKRIANSWRATGADIVHINKQNLEDGLDMLAAAPAAGIPTVTTIHLTQSARYLNARGAYIRDLVSRRALRNYPGPFVAVLEQRGRELREFLDSQQTVRVIQNGVPLFDLSNREQLRMAKRAELGIADEFLIVAVGRMVPQKRPLTFLEHARRIVSAYPNARFMWIGDGTLAGEWDRLVAELGLGKTVRRLPWQREVAPVLFAADLFLHVAEFEGLPLALLEAMSAGLPCAVAGHLLAEMPFFRSGDVIAVGCNGEWAAALKDPAHLATLGSRMRQLAAERFSYDAMAEQYESLYQEVLSERAIAPSPSPV